MKIKLTNVRISFPSLFHTAEFGGQDTGKFGAEFLLDKKEDIAQIKAFGEAMKVVAKEKWPNGLQGQPLPSKDKLCIKDGKDKERDGFENVYIVKASTDVEPSVVDQARQPITNERKVYAGCRVNGVIDIWAQDNKFGKRINARLLGVQFVKDDTPFGSTFDPQSEFDVIEGSTQANDDIFGDAGTPNYENIPDESLPF